MKATGRADLAANEKVLDLYTSNLQLEDQLHGVRKEVEDAKSIAEKVAAGVLHTVPLDGLLQLHKRARQCEQPVL